MSMWTPRVTARAELAEVLSTRFLERATAAGITKGELEAVAKNGRAAEQADRLQKEQLAAGAAGRANQKDVTRALFDREEALRDRLPAVAGELSEGSPADREQGAWLSKLSFARYRFRELHAATSTPADEAAAAEVKAVERVERYDAATHLNGLEAFCQALLKPGREAIVDKLAARGLPRATLESLATDARAVIELGRNVKRSAEATATESEAAHAQLVVWRRIRRMVRKAVNGVPELEGRFAGC